MTQSVFLAIEGRFGLEGQIQTMDNREAAFQAYCNVMQDEYFLEAGEKDGETVQLHPTLTFSFV